jgi:hypothetical protein
MWGTKYFGGAKSSQPAKLARFVEDGLLIGGPVRPKSLSLSSFAGPVKNQRGSQGCQGHVGATCLDTAYAANGVKALPFSPWYIWTVGRMKDRAQVSSGNDLPKLTNIGTESADVILGYAEYGAGSLAPDAVDGSDVTDDYEMQVDTSQLQGGAVRPILGPYQINTRLFNAIDRVANAMAQNCPVHATFYADDACLNADRNTILGHPKVIPGENRGHAVALLGFDTRVDGSLLVRLRSSWGLQWADMGECWADASWLGDCYEVFPYRLMG